MEEHQNEIITNDSNELVEETVERWNRVIDMPVDVATLALEAITFAFRKAENGRMNVDRKVDEANIVREGKVALKVPLIAGVVLGMAFYGIFLELFWNEIWGGVGFALGLALCFLPYRMYKKKCASKADKILDEARKMNKIVDDYIATDEWCQLGISALPEGYRCSEKSSYMLKCLQDGIASSPREAFKLCDEEMHRRYMEYKASEHSYLMGEQLNTLDNISAQIDDINSKIY